MSNNARCFQSLFIYRGKEERGHPAVIPFTPAHPTPPEQLLPASQVHTTFYVAVLFLRTPGDPPRFVYRPMLFSPHKHTLPQIK